MSLIARIEDDLCLAHGDCEAVAPEAFRVDDVARVVGETTDERLRAAARATSATPAGRRTAAAARCAPRSRGVRRGRGCAATRR